MSISVSVAGKSGTNVTATNGDTINVTISPTGTPGGVGPATNISVGTVTTLNAGQPATVTSKLTDANLVLSFGLPRGADGINGSGVTPAIKIGNVTTLAAGQNASVTATTTNGGANVTLNFALPAGANGAAGGVSSINGLTGAVQLAAGPNVTISSSNLTLTIDAKVGSGGLGASDSVDGGTYTGTILGGITFTVQPQSQTVSTSSNITFANTSNSLVSLALFASGANLFSFGSTDNDGTNSYANLSVSTDNGSSWSPLGTVLNIPNSENQIVGTMGRASVASNGSRTVFVPGVGTTVNYRYAGPGVLYSDSANLSSISATTNLSFAGAAHSVAYSSTAARWVASTMADLSYYNANGTLISEASQSLLYSSSDGANWTFRAGSVQGASYRVVAVGGRFVAMPEWRRVPSVDQSTWVDCPYKYSDSGVSWTTAAHPLSAINTQCDIASSGTRAVAVGETTVKYTTDGITWGTATLPVTCSRIEYARGLFWAWNGNGLPGTDICTSPDGVTWTLRTRPASTSLLGLAAASGSNVAFLLNGGSTHATATVTSSAASANFTVAATASGNAAVSFQWQRSLDAGSTWTNIANATGTALNLTGLTTANSAERYRAQASATGAVTKNSQSATLTVTE